MIIIYFTNSTGDVISHFFLLNIWHWKKPLDTVTALTDKRVNSITTSGFEYTWMYISQYLKFILFSDFVSDRWTGADIKHYFNSPVIFLCKESY